MGLREEILKSKSKKELESLLEVGSKFKFPSTRTKKSWIAAYKKRIKQLDVDVKNTKKVKKTKKVKDVELN